MALVDQVLLGVYIGVLTGVFTALLVFSMAVAFQYFAGVAFPGTMGLMIGLGSAGLQGGLFGLMRNPKLLQSPTIVTTLVLVLGITLYAQKKGQDLGKALPPKSALLKRLRSKTLSPDVVRQMGRFGQVRVRVTGEVSDIEGYPPLPADLRAKIREGEWTFPGDLPLAELEKRLAEKLVSEHDLDDVAVSIDPEGLATVAAAPPSSGLSRRVPEGTQAVSVDAVVPTGLARGDAVTVTFAAPAPPSDPTGATGPADDADGAPAESPPPEPEREEFRVDATVVSVQTAPESATPAAAEGDGGESEDAPTPGPEAPKGAQGGSGRVALAVDAADVPAVVDAEARQLLVEPKGKNVEYELVSLLRQQGNGFRKLPVALGSEFVDRPIGELDLRGTYGVAVLAIKRGDAWIFAPDGAVTVQADDDLFVSGDRASLDRVAEVVA